jgi:hypothetical protein
MDCNERKWLCAAAVFVVGGAIKIANEFCDRAVAHGEATITITKPAQPHEVKGHAIRELNDLLTSQAPYPGFL